MELVGWKQPIKKKKEEKKGKMSWIFWLGSLLLFLGGSPNPSGS